MSLQSRLGDLITVVGADIKDLKTKTSDIVIGDKISALSPTSWWKFAETSGSFVDFGSAGIAGTYVSGLRGLSPGAKKTQRAVGEATGTPTTGTAYATFGNNYGFAGRLPFTFLMFHKPLIYGTNFRRLLHKNDATAGPFLGLNTAGQPAVFRAGSPGATTLPSTKIVTLGEWQMYVFAYDGNAIYLFHNGDWYNMMDTGDMPSSVANLRLHGEPGNAANWGANGLVSDLAVWSSFLSQAQVDTIWKVFAR